MVIKIFFLDKAVFLCDEITSVIKEFMHCPDVIFMDEISAPAIKTLLHEIAKPGFHAGIIFNNDFAKLKKNFYKYFKLIQAAGGLVKNEADEFLFIFRRGKWDLPKGKNDGDETAEQCASREVKEETGLVHLEIQRKICTTYHTYYDSKELILKETEWFNMISSSDQKLVPQVDEDIQKIEWVSTKNITDKLKNSFPLITDVLINADISFKG